MTTGHDDLGIEGATTAFRAPSSASVSASSTAPHRPSYDNAVDSASITAELPVTGRARRHGEGYDDGRSVRARRRDPAPVLLRFLVWVLFFLLILMIAGAVVQQRRPAWFAFLDNTAPTASSLPRSPTPTTVPKAPTSNAMTLLSRSGQSATYSVPASSYALVLTSPGACYVEIKSPPNESGYVYAHTVPPAKRPTTIPQHGTIAVTLEAQATSLGVKVGTRSVGSIPAPKIGYTYIFKPHSS